MSTDISEHMKATYRALRLGVAVLGILLPWLLWIAGRVAGAPLQPSMSDYYDAGMRDEFVAVLCAVAFLLVSYKGYTSLENWALNLGGAFLVGVALVPTGRSWLHGTFAVLFFVCIAYVCLFRASDTIGLIHDPERRRRFTRTYQLLGVGMILSPVGAVILTFVLHPTSLTFFVEALGVSAFAAYWLVKGRELAETDAEALARHGGLAVPPHGPKNLFQRLPVERKIPTPLGAEPRHATG